MTFENLNLIEPLLQALKTEGYETPTPIQVQAIPLILARKDVLGCAQTGTGKTAAFALPILQNFHEERLLEKGQKHVKALILTPTRELAIQIDESFAAYGRNVGMSHAVIFGGVSQNPQVGALKRGVDILTATPGRLLDLMNQGFVHLEHVKVFVLDEADRMLDMGFIHDVKKVIAKLPQKRQTLFFSATMPPEIQKLADTILTDPEKVAVTPVSSTAEMVEQALYFVDKRDKKNLLVHLLKDPAIESALIFTRTKHGANRLAKDLTSAGIPAEAIHGNKSQQARQRALGSFKAKETRVLVATDIAARGIDIDELSHVVNYELPNVPETYVHRIGRTGRAGLSGTAISFCEGEEREYLRDIHKLIGRQIPVVDDHPFADGKPRVFSEEPPRRAAEGRSQRQAPPREERQQRDDSDRQPSRSRNTRGRGGRGRGGQENRDASQTPQQERRQPAGESRQQRQPQQPRRDDRQQQGGDGSQVSQPEKQASGEQKKFYGSRPVQPRRDEQPGRRQENKSGSPPNPNRQKQASAGDKRPHPGNKPQQSRQKDKPSPPTSEPGNAILEKKKRWYDIFKLRE